MISSWAENVQNYFPNLCGLRDATAGVEIRVNFDDFTALSKANETSLDKLVMATKSGDPGAMIAGLKNLVSSCNACHKLYKVQTHLHLSRLAKTKPVAIK